MNTESDAEPMEESPTVAAAGAGVNRPWSIVREDARTPSPGTPNSANPFFPIYGPST